MEGSRLFTAEQFEIRFLLGFSLATFTEKSCKCSSQAERERLIHIAATQSGVFLVNKLRAVNLQLSKYKLIDGGRKTCLCHTETGVGTDPDDRHCPYHLNRSRPEDQSTYMETKTLFKPAVQAPITSGYLCKMSLFCV